jgi:hypothetical protein
MALLLSETISGWPADHSRQEQTERVEQLLGGSEWTCRGSSHSITRA